MFNFFLIAVSCTLAALLVVVFNRQIVLRREAYIRSFELPRGLFEQLRKHHPDLTLKDCQLVAHGLRQFFLSHLKSGRQYVAMPSQIADDLWHEFILYTRNYQLFCQKAFGGFLHHTPAVVMGSSERSSTGLRRCFWFACREENINPRRPSRLPLLFALDSKFNVTNGFHYVADCDSIRRNRTSTDTGATVYCGGDFSASGAGAGMDAFIDAGPSADAGYGGDLSGGCGGGGCGGGGD